MAAELDKLLDQIYQLREQIEQYFKDAEQRFRYSLKDGRVAFSDTIKAEHKTHRKPLLAYLLNARLSSIISAPVIYSMIVPICLLDLMITCYQKLCFRFYRISTVCRSEYMVNDRHKLAYLNSIEKINCAYCGYANGVIAYSREILSRTEQYWCPIRHANRIPDAHQRYTDFCDFGDAQGYRTSLEQHRNGLKQE